MKSPRSENGGQNAEVSCVRVTWKRPDDGSRRTEGGEGEHVTSCQRPANGASLREARARMPLEAVLEQYGVAPHNGHWKNFTCPFCKEPGAGITERNGLKFFKCFHTSCPTGTKALPDIQFIAQSSGISNRDAFVAFLKMAGVWKERTVLKSASPKPKPSEPPPEAADAQADAEVAQNPEQIVDSSPKAPVSRHREQGDSSEQDPLLAQVIELAKIQKITRRSIAKRFGIRTVRAGQLAVAAKAITGTINGSRKPSDTASGGGGNQKSGCPEPSDTTSGTVKTVPDGFRNGCQPDSGNHAEPEKPSELIPEAAAIEPEMLAVREFYAKLTAADPEPLWRKRGLTAETCRVLGFKANPQTNLALLRELEYPPTVLEKSGLFTFRRHQMIVAGGQPGADRAQSVRF